MQLSEACRGYRHISFDLWLTLIRSCPGFKERRNALFRSFFDIAHPIEKVASVIRHYDVTVNDLNEKTGGNVDTFQMYYLILSGLGIEPKSVEIGKLETFYELTEGLLLDYCPELIYPDIHRLLDTLVSEENTASILSNTAFIKGRSLRKVLTRYGLDGYFSFQLYSDETGFSKPSQEMFRRVFEQANTLKLLEKREILHIGDNKVADYDGALTFGFGAHLLKPEYEYQL